MRHFKFWCQKVLPLVYDDSLSYYEVLCKVVKYINELIDGYEDLDNEVTEIKEAIGDIGDLDELKEQIRELRAEIAVIQEWIDNFDTETIEQLVIECIANMFNILYTSTITDSDKGTAINTAIGNGVRTIYVDNEITVDKPISLVSGMTVQGLGGKVKFTGTNNTGGKFSTGRLGNDTYTPERVLTHSTTKIVTGTKTINVADASGVVVGKRYKIVGTTDLFDKTNFEGADAAYWLGSGTSSANVVYGNMEFIATAVSGNTVTMDRQAPYYIGTIANVMEPNDFENITIRNLDIEAEDEPIWLQYINNCSIDNCSINCRGEYPVYLKHAYECEVVNCSISNTVPEGAQSPHRYNSIVIATGGENKIGGNKITGGYQNIDISYIQRLSYNNVVSNNTMFGASYDSFTTHPAGINNLIIGNRCGGDIAIRSRGNSVISNQIGGNISAGFRRCDNTCIIGNVIDSEFPIVVTYQSDGAAPYDNVYISNNIALGCRTFISGTSFNDATTVDSSLNLFVTDNIVHAALDASGAPRQTGLIALRHNNSNPAPLKKLIVSGNSFVGCNIINLFTDLGYGSDNQQYIDKISIEDFELKNNNFDSGIVYAYRSDQFSTVTITASSSIIDGNNKDIARRISGSTRSNVGAEFPNAAYAIPGDTYLKTDGTYGVFDGTTWRIISAT